MNILAIGKHCNQCFSLLAVFSEVAKRGEEEEKLVEGGRKKLNKHIV